MRHVQYILIHEMIFIARNLLTHIDSRLHQDFPGNFVVHFGGRPIILVGDLGQLPLVMDRHHMHVNCMQKNYGIYSQLL